MHGLDAPGGSGVDAALYSICVRSQRDAQFPLYGPLAAQGRLFHWLMARFASLPQDDSRDLQLQLPVSNGYLHCESSEEAAWHLVFVALHNACMTPVNAFLCASDAQCVSTVTSLLSTDSLDVAPLVASTAFRMAPHLHSDTLGPQCYSSFLRCPFPSFDDCDSHFAP